MTGYIGVLGFKKPNLILDGSFLEVSNWHIPSASYTYTLESSNNQLNLTALLTTVNQVWQEYTAISGSTSSTNQKVYYRAEIKGYSTNSTGYPTFRYGGYMNDSSTESFINILANDGKTGTQLNDNNWHVCSEILNTYGTNTWSYFDVLFTMLSPSVDDKMSVKKIIVVNLTDVYGSGNEPTKSWCDENINLEGDTVLFNSLNGIAHKCKNLYIGVNNIARKIKKGYIGVGDVAKQWYSFSPDFSSLFADANLLVITGHNASSASSKGLQFDSSTYQDTPIYILDFHGLGYCIGKLYNTTFTKFIGSDTPTTYTYYGYNIINVSMRDGAMVAVTFPHFTEAEVDAAFAAIHQEEIYAGVSSSSGTRSVANNKFTGGGLYVVAHGYNGGNMSISSEEDLFTPIFSATVDGTEGIVYLYRSGDTTYLSVNGERSTSIYGGRISRLY